MNFIQIIIAQATAPAPQETQGLFLLNLLIGMVLGLIGQAARASVGLKKESDAKGSDTSLRQVFDGSQLMISLLYGAAAGGLAALLLGSDKMKLVGNDQSVWLALVGAGYSGSDFIEGLMTKAKGHGQKLLDSVSETSGKIDKLGD
ncbi:MAG: hypothetical protein LDL31_05460 [Prosthecobacter sp.]|jgi:hypothetical protein|nr:hypothetical protein [Prosthecobacter sp.]